MKRFLKEPLLHFVVLGALLFSAYTWLHRGADNSRAGRQVHISENDVKWLTETWTRQWQRAPTREELRGLVTDFLKEELLAREARTMGLDENDAIVRRRLAQKVEFLVQDAARLADPSEDDLRRFYAARPELFSEEARVSFTHVYFSRDHRKEIAAALSRLQANANPMEMGERLLIEPELHNANQQTVAGQFGSDFARAVFALPAGSWHGPIESGYGLHLVRVSELKPARKREFAEVRAQVLERWRDNKERESNEKYFAGLLEKYDVVLDESVKPLVGEIGAETRRGNREVR